MSGLWPREHGAYAQLGFPLAAGLIYAGGQPGALGFAVTAAAIFFAHEPVAVLSGTRGVRLREKLGRSARSRLGALALAALLGLAVALARAPGRAWWAAVVPGALALILLPLLGTRRLKSVAGEILAAAVFSTSLLPVALCGDTEPRTAALAAGVWFVAVVPAVLAVHAIKVAVKGKREGQWTLVAAPALAFLAVTGSAVLALLLPPWGRPVLAVLPPALAILAVTRMRPHPRYLKRVGWTLVAADTLTLFLLFSL